ncbi:hypothetical protein BGZ63DRAFT_404382 [Mariannaea sp. PMI_226]|nr:hypothetical protein BGZ63DRAFT_404382 [Mariannaea sp. PMI_226]
MDSSLGTWNVSYHALDRSIYRLPMQHEALAREGKDCHAHYSCTVAPSAFPVWMLRVSTPFQVTKLRISVSMMPVTLRDSVACPWICSPGPGPAAPPHSVYFCSDQHDPQLSQVAQHIRLDSGVGMSVLSGGKHQMVQGMGEDGSQRFLAIEEWAKQQKLWIHRPIFPLSRAKFILDPYVLPPILISMFK